MQAAVVFRILGILLMVFSTTMLPPAAVGFIYRDHTVMPFINGFMILMVLGFVLWFNLRHVKREMRLRDGFVVVVMFWAGLGIAGAVPLMLAERPDVSFAEAVFESISALTTTGATVLVGLDVLPRSILFYRQQLQWLGGMGIIVLAVAILPMLGIGGMQLYRAETPGPVKDSKLTPRITETAKALWYVYLLLTAACMAAYWAAGMDGFDALAHAFSTVAIGGFSPHDASIGYFDSPLIEAIAVFFMAIAGVNFALHFMVLRTGNLRAYLRDAEFKTFMLLLVAASATTVIYLYVTGVATDFVDALRLGIFQTVSVATTTGFTTADFSAWPTFVAVSLLLLSFIGGCAGSTGGGMKVIRFILLFKQSMRETMRLIHPNATIVVKVGDKPLSDRVVEAVWGFFSAYVFVFVVFMLIMLATGMDQVTAFSAVAASLNNLGPGLGNVAANYSNISDLQMLVLSFAMLMGRLEIFTLLVLLTPAFWQQ
jgi:trk system potassium uptake protein TrkH